MVQSKQISTYTGKKQKQFPWSLRAFLLSKLLMTLAGEGRGLRALLFHPQCFLWINNLQNNLRRHSLGGNPLPVRDFLIKKAPEDNQPIWLQQVWQQSGTE